MTNLQSVLENAYEVKINESIQEQPLGQSPEPVFKCRIFECTVPFSTQTMS